MSCTGDRADERRRLRAAVLESAPRWYSPRAHLLLTTLLGALPMAIGLYLIDDPGATEIAAGLALIAAASAIEHRVHRRVLHRRRRLLGRLYDEHTPEHHAIFLTADMAIAGLAEARLVLIPASGIAAIVGAIAPVAAALVALGLGNLGGLFLAVAAGYVLAYEWIHLLAHWPEHSAFGRLAPLTFLRRHHAIHHHPSRMQRCNFNVVLPLADVCAGTLRRGSDPQ